MSTILSAQPVRNLETVRLTAKKKSEMSWVMYTAIPM